MKFQIPDDEQTRLAFDFFYRFGRIEYALKEQGFAKPRRNDNSAQVDRSVQLL